MPSPTARITTKEKRVFALLEQRDPRRRISVRSAAALLGKSTTTVMLRYARLKLAEARRRR